MNQNRNTIHLQGNGIINLGNINLIRTNLARDAVTVDINARVENGSGNLIGKKFTLRMDQDGNTVNLKNNRVFRSLNIILQLSNAHFIWANEAFSGVAIDIDAWVESHIRHLIGQEFTLRMNKHRNSALFQLNKIKAIDTVNDPIALSKVRIGDLVLQKDRVHINGNSLSTKLKVRGRCGGRTSSGVFAHSRGISDSFEDFGDCIDGWLDKTSDSIGIFISNDSVVNSIDSSDGS